MPQDIDRDIWRDPQGRAVALGKYRKMIEEVGELAHNVGHIVQDLLDRGIVVPTVDAVETDEEFAAAAGPATYGAFLALRQGVVKRIEQFLAELAPWSYEVGQAAPGSTLPSVNGWPPTKLFAVGYVPARDYTLVVAHDQAANLARTNKSMEASGHIPFAAYHMIVVGHDPALIPTKMTLLVNENGPTPRAIGITPWGQRSEVKAALSDVPLDPVDLARRILRGEGAAFDDAVVPLEVINAVKRALIDANIETVKLGRRHGKMAEARQVASDHDIDPPDWPTKPPTIGKRPN